MAISEEEDEKTRLVIKSLGDMDAAAQEHVAAQNGLIRSVEDGIVSYKKLNQSIEERILAEKGLVKTMTATGPLYETFNENNKSRIKSEQEINAQLLITVGATKLAIAAAEKNEAIKKKLFDDTIRSLGGYIDASNKFVNTTIKLDVAQQQQIKGIKELNAALESPGKSFQDAASKTKSMGDVAQQGKAKLNELAEGSKLATIGVAGLEAVALIAVSAIKGLYAGAEAMTKSIYSGDRGQKVAAKGVTATTAEFTKLTESLGGMLIGIGSATIALGILAAPLTGGLSLLAVVGGAAVIGLGGMAQAAGKAAKTLAELNEAAAEQNDKLFEGFNALAQSSMIGARGMTGLMDDLHEMGFVVKDFEKFKKVLDANAKSMNLFGTTAEKGVSLFVTTTGDLINSELGRIFQLMGITAEDQAEHAAKYMAQEASFYTLQRKSGAEITAGLGKYIEELDKAAALTGVTRKEQESAREQIRSMVELQSAIEDAEESGDKDEMAKLKKAQRDAEWALAAGMKDTATAIVQLASGRGVVNEKTAVLSNQSSKYAQMIHTGSGSESERREAMLEGGANSRRQVRENLKILGAEGGKGITLDPGVSNDQQMRATTRIAARDKDEAAAKAAGRDFDAEKWEKEYIARQAKDPKTVAQVDLVRKQQLEYAIDMDNIVSDFGDAVNINSLAADAFEKAVELFDRAANPEKWKKIDEERAQKAAAAEEQKRMAGRTAPLEVGDETTAARLSSTGAQRLAGNKRGATAADQDRLTGGGSEHGSAVNMAEDDKNKSKKPEKPVSTRISRFNRGREERAAQQTKDGSSGSTPGEKSKDGKSQSDLEKMGLSIKSGDVQAENSPVSDKLIELAQKIQGEIPGFKIFTGFNDVYHQKNKPGSEHTKGLALDFVLDKKPSIEEGEEMVKMLKSMGANYALDEYNFKSGKATGPHMHAQISAAMGGIASGPTSGYPATLHGSEMITPLEPNSILEKLAKTAASSPTTESASSVTIDQTMRDMASMHSEMMSMFENKLDDMIGKLGTSNDLQDQLLKYSRV